MATTGERVIQSLAEGIQFAASNGPAQAMRRIPTHAMGRRLGSMRSAESIHHIDIAKRGVLA